MYILGLSGYAHEASCALLKDGRLLSLLEEERFNREKHTWKYPQKAIAQCLAQAGITINDVACITFFWVPNREIVGNITHFLKYFPQSLNLLKAPSGGEELGFFKRVSLMRHVGEAIQQQFGLAKTPKVHFIEHHLCHAASSFFVSPFEEAAILTIDGRGESTSTMLSIGRGHKIKKIKEIKVPHSLGHLYAAITDYLGFRPFFDEWKVMGLSAYGKDTYVKDFEDLLRLTSDGGYQLNLKYFRFHTHGQKEWVAPEFIKKFGPKRHYRDSYDGRVFDIAFALQRTIERVGVHLAKKLYELT